MDEAKKSIWWFGSMLALCGGFIGILGDIPFRDVYRMIDSAWPRALWIGVPCGLILGILILFFARPTTTDRSTVAVFIVMMIGSLVTLGQLTLKIVNGYLDDSTPLPVRGTIEKIGGGKNPTVIRITEAGPLEGRTVYLPRAKLPRIMAPTPRELENGDGIVLLAHPGRLGLAWWRETRVEVGNL